MKRYMWVVLLVALVVCASFAVSRHVGLAKGQAGEAVAQNGEAGPQVSFSVSPGGLKTAAINSNGTVAGCYGCTSASQISTGQYQVTFPSNVQAINGTTRWVQVDNLTVGTIDNESCTTADRVGNADAIFVACFNNATGAFVNTNFILFVLH
jgi:hypothetical protein